MRLTKKKNNEYIANTEINTRSQQFAWLRQLGFKLGQLEDIEDELGIDLVTLFNEEFKKIAKCYIKKEQFIYAPNFIKSMKHPRDSKGRFVKRS